MSTLLISIPNEYQRQLNMYTHAKQLWDAFEKCFVGTQSTKRNQKAIFRRQYENFNVVMGESLTQTVDRFIKLNRDMTRIGVRVGQEDII